MVLATRPPNGDAGGMNQRCVLQSLGKRRPRERRETKEQGYRHPQEVGNGVDTRLDALVSSDLGRPGHRDGGEGAGTVKLEDRIY
jgi:hypothetical protein